MNLPLGQNHRTAGVGRDLCGSSSPTPLPKKGHPQQAAEDLVQAGNLCQGSVTLKVLELLCFSLCPLPLVLSLGITEKSLDPSS